MKIEYIRHKDIDKIKWDDCVKSCKNHLPYCYSWYLDIVSPEWDALISDEYKKIFPLTFRTKARISYLFQPYFTQQLGLFGDNVSNEVLEEFLNAIPEKFKFIEINLNTFCALNAKDFIVKAKLTHFIDLNRSYHEIFSEYNDNTKRNIRKAEKESLRFAENGNVKTLIGLFKSNIGKQIELQSGDYKLLESLLTASVKNKTGQVYEVLDSENNLLASMFLLSSQNTCINLFNASSDFGKKKSAMFFLINEIIKKNAASSKLFDFEGSEIPEVARFYKGFGGKPVQYPHIRRNRLPWPLKWIKE